MSEIKPTNYHENVSPTPSTHFWI